MKYRMTFRKTGNDASELSKAQGLLGKFPDVKDISVNPKRGTLSLTGDYSNKLEVIEALNLEGLMPITLMQGNTTERFITFHSRHKLSPSQRNKLELNLENVNGVESMNSKYYSPNKSGFIEVFGNFNPTEIYSEITKIGCAIKCW